VLSLIHQVPEELWGAKLALQVLVHRIAGPSSHFATYISYLPIGVSGVPMFFPREALEAIEYPPVVEQVGAARPSVQLYCSCAAAVQCTA
jgi:histone-lysine N-methyltransferase SETD3